MRFLHQYDGAIDVIFTVSAMLLQALGIPNSGRSRRSMEKGVRVRVDARFILTPASPRFRRSLPPVDPPRESFLVVVDCPWQQAERSP